MAETAVREVELRELGEAAALSIGAGMVAAWREIVAELERPVSQKTTTGYLYHLKPKKCSWETCKTIAINLTVRLSGSFLAGLIFAELVLAAGAPAFERPALMVGGLLGWRFIDAWQGQLIEKIRERIRR